MSLIYDNAGLGKSFTDRSHRYYDMCEEICSTLFPAPEQILTVDGRKEICNQLSHYAEKWDNEGSTHISNLFNAHAYLVIEKAGKAGMQFVNQNQPLKSFSGLAPIVKVATDELAFAAVTLIAQHRTSPLSPVRNNFFIWDHPQS
ncbi:MAG: hypothetical protein DI551_11765 [Micavibrio aeruginosavorus]|uniref:Uncharacterized protein n=1 Tax=Micavibrio aeruginosavorus TaxID=349221 RepID=A0A2W5MSA5_9BACT|nr:MAG: hypothetical protein DI551_11765 [Micavibrio aeruginosavorus]